jgi:hypothetical protein
VGELCRCLDFALETGERLGVGGLAGLDQLDRAGALEQLVFRPVHLAHAARAELGVQYVLTQLPCLEGFAANRSDHVSAEDGHADGDERHRHGDAEVVRLKCGSSTASGSEPLRTRPPQTSEAGATKAAGAPAGQNSLPQTRPE